MRKLFFYGLVVQVVVLYAGLDLNFKSPLQQDLPQYKTTLYPPSDRLVLFVADGLRYERFAAFSERNLTPHLNKIKDYRGASGIAVASVPTESRPGHISMLAGIYEDPSAIFRGWQDNPVEFDSMINQSGRAYGWGSPDILNLFNKANHPHIHFYTYDRRMQDFSNPSIELDRWVMDRVQEIFDETEEEKCDEFCAPETIYFLHLLGMDNAGHAYKPYSKKYEENLKYVDEVVRRVEALFDEFFYDDKTTFIFTADHGMTDWGSHGSGSEDETHVPVLAWGAGIKKGPKDIIKQKDLAPLMAALLGTRIPTNSLGRLPIEYLNVSKKVLAEMTYANMQQFAALYYKSEEEIKDVIDFKPFPLLSAPYFLDNEILTIRRLIRTEEYDSAIKNARTLMYTFEEGRRYYLGYCKKFLMIVLVVALVFWTAYLLIMACDNYEDDVLIRGESEMEKMPCLEWTASVAGMGLPISYIVVYMSGLSRATYLYVSLPFLCMSLLIANYQQVIYAVKSVARVGFYEFSIQFFLYVIGISLLIASFSHRVYLIPVLTGISIWAWMQNEDFTQTDKVLWSMICTIVSIYLVLPSVAEQDRIIHAIGVVAWFVATVMIVRYINRTPRLIPVGNPPNYRICPFKTLIGVFGMCLLLGFGVRLLETIPVPVHLFCWFLIGLATIIPFVMPGKIIYRLIFWLFSLMSYYALVSVGYELLFMSAYVCLLAQWIRLEDKQAYFGHTSFFDFHPHRSRLDDLGQHLLRRTFFYLTFVLLGLFGTGNFAELSSFDPMWVRPLITSFSPFIITGLIVIKISVVIMLCTLAVFTLTVTTPSKVGTLFALLMAFCKVMVIVFFIQIQNEGSWLDIGTSLSKFIISTVLTLILMIYYHLSYVLVTTTIDLD